jgi:hypothetical protein
VTLNVEIPQFNLYLYVNYENSKCSCFLGHTVFLHNVREVGRVLLSRRRLFMRSTARLMWTVNLTS